MIIITLSYEFQKDIYNDKGLRDAEQKILIVLTILNLVTYFLKFFFPASPCQGIIFILFLLTNSKILKRAVERSWKILTSIYEVLMLQLVGLVIVAYFINIVTYGKFSLKV